MRQTDKKKEKDKIAIVLMLCFCVVALTSIFTIKSNIEKISDNGKNVPVSDEVATEEKNKKNAENDSTEDNSTAASIKVPTIVSEGAKSNSTGQAAFTKPIVSHDAKLLKEYSMDMVIYSVTLDQFMTHSGVDIAAPEDTRVKAIAAGTVTDVYKDDGYGLTIEITHDNGYISKYSNLSTDKMVEKGDVVTQGQTISGVGKTALFESMEPAHLHLEILKAGKLVNPSELIKF